MTNYYRKTNDSAEIGCGLFFLLTILAFWGAVIFIGIHFIANWW